MAHQSLQLNSIEKTVQFPDKFDDVAVHLFISLLLFSFSPHSLVPVCSASSFTHSGHVDHVTADRAFSVCGRVSFAVFNSGWSARAAQVRLLLKRREKEKRGNWKKSGEIKSESMRPIDALQLLLPLLLLLLLIMLMPSANWPFHSPTADINQDDRVCRQKRWRKKREKEREREKKRKRERERERKRAESKIGHWCDCCWLLLSLRWSN